MTSSAFRVAVPRRSTVTTRLESRHSTRPTPSHCPRRRPADATILQSCARPPHLSGRALKHRFSGVNREPIVLSGVATLGARPTEVVAHLSVHQIHGPVHRHSPFTLVADTN